MDHPESVSIVDYGVGNLGSIVNMLHHVDVGARLVTRPDELAAADRVLLPGVGAFDRGIKGLTETGMLDAVRAAATRGCPILGVCLGMQLLTDASDEGVRPGLGIVRAKCRKLVPATSRERVPHMGWDWVNETREHPVLQNLPQPAKFYFAHSFYVDCQDSSDVLATTDFGDTGAFTSAFARDNVVGVQFHPEKSHAFGMALLSNFARWRP